MAKKFNLTKGLAGRLTGGLVGGAASAVWDKYVVPMFGQTFAGYEDYLKLGVGAVLPALIKNDMVTSVGDSLIAIGANNIVAGLLETDVPAGDTGADTGVSGRALVNGGRFPAYRKYVKPTVNGGAKPTVKVNSAVR